MKEFDVIQYIHAQSPDEGIERLLSGLFSRMERDKESEGSVLMSVMLNICMHALSRKSKIMVGTVQSLTDSSEVTAMWNELDGKVYDIAIFGCFNYPGNPWYEMLRGSFYPVELPVVAEDPYEIPFGRYVGGHLPMRWPMFEAVAGVSLRDYLNLMPYQFSAKVWRDMTDILNEDCGLKISRESLIRIASGLKFPAASSITLGPKEAIVSSRNQ